MMQKAQFLTRVTRRVSLVEQELITLPERMSSTLFRNFSLGVTLTELDPPYPLHISKCKASGKYPTD
jgi:hypothetical protein